MEWQIPQTERSYLRTLAKKQAEYAALPIMETREEDVVRPQRWRTQARPPGDHRDVDL